MLTSKNQKVDEFWGKKQGAAAYLTKPFDNEVLLKAVSENLL
jgi:twitching motility two-component system response regulator PilH